MDPADVSAGHTDRGRFSVRRKTQVVIRLLRGEDIDALSRELGVTGGLAVAGERTWSRWRERSHYGGGPRAERRLDGRHRV